MNLAVIASEDGGIRRVSAFSCIGSNLAINTLFVVFIAFVKLFGL